MSDARNEPFHDLPRQRHAAEFGLWVFLASEMVFFGGLIAAYALYRHIYTPGFEAAGAETNIWLGTANTAILLTSSAAMAVAVWAGAAGLKRHVLIGLVLTAALGLAFLAVKGVEYGEDISKSLFPTAEGFPVEARGARIFFGFYWAMTGLHAVHMTIGLGAVALTAWRVALDRFDWQRTGLLHTLGLYWHFVDLVWIVLYPLLYLPGRST
jgi:cytochrome c oxidase subunit III